MSEGRACMETQPKLYIFCEKGIYQLNYDDNSIASLGKVYDTLCDFLKTEKIDENSRRFMLDHPTPFFQDHYIENEDLENILEQRGSRIQIWQKLKKWFNKNSLWDIKVGGVRAFAYC